MINPNDNFLFQFRPQDFYGLCQTINSLSDQDRHYTRLLKTFLEVVQQNPIHLIKPCWNICCNYWVMRRYASPFLDEVYYEDRKKTDVIFWELSLKVAENYQAAIGRYQNPEKGKYIMEDVVFLESLFPLRSEIGK